MKKIDFIDNKIPEKNVICCTAIKRNKNQTSKMYLHKQQRWQQCAHDDFVEIISGDRENESESKLVYWETHQQNPFINICV